MLGETLNIVLSIWGSRWFSPTTRHDEVRLRNKAVILCSVRSFAEKHGSVLTIA